MVCSSCETALKKSTVPDPVIGRVGKSKGGPIRGGSAATTAAAGYNKALASASTPYSKVSNCRICKSKLHDNSMNFCNDCAHKKGICTRCGKYAVDISKHVMKLK